MNTYDSWLQNYDGYLESLPRADYDIKYDHEEDVYMVYENNLYLEAFKKHEDAETYIDYLLGE